jgi:2,4-dienoyl-CoA reductase-like NADH-dependent reductase (Old Yellow Enzyme family)
MSPTKSTSYVWASRLVPAAELGPQLYYTQRAQGGAGLIRTEGTLISPQGTQWPHAPGIWSDEHVVAWKKVTDAVHDAGGAIFVQLWHVGRIAHPDMPEHKASGKV